MSDNVQKLRPTSPRKGSSRNGLPTACPTWCRTEHARALDEGCGLESASLHVGPEAAGRLDDLVQPTTKVLLRAGGAHWSLLLMAEHDPAGSWWRPPIVQLEVYEKGSSQPVELRMTGSEARTLARQLEHLADLYDLEGM